VTLIKSTNIILFLFIVTFLFPVKETTAQYQVGSVVNNFSIDDLYGDKINFYDYKGKVILLYLFRST